MMVMMTVATNMPPQPPTLKPRFQPEKSPEITAPTPSAHNDEDAGVAPQLTLFEIVLAGVVIGDPAFMSFFVSHFQTPRIAPAQCKFTPWRGSLQPGCASAARRRSASRSAQLRWPGSSPISSLRISIMAAGRPQRPAWRATV